MNNKSLLKQSAFVLWIGSSLYQVHAGEDAKPWWVALRNSAPLPSELATQPPLPWWAGLEVKKVPTLTMTPAPLVNDPQGAAKQGSVADSKEPFWHEVKLAMHSEFFPVVNEPADKDAPIIASVQFDDDDHIYEGTVASNQPAGSAMTDSADSAASEEEKADELRERLNRLLNQSKESETLPADDNPATTSGNTADTPSSQAPDQVIPAPSAPATAGPVAGATPSTPASTPVTPTAATKSTNPAPAAQPTSPLAAQKQETVTVTKPTDTPAATSTEPKPASNKNGKGKSALSSRLEALSNPKPRTEAKEKPKASAQKSRPARRWKMVEEESFILYDEDSIAEAKG